MKSLLRRIFGKLLPYQEIREARCIKKNRAEYEEWLQEGKPVPPPDVVKQSIVKKYAGIYDCTTLVETGTFLGEMVHAVCNDFEKIYSIELSRKLYRRARKKFSKLEHIRILQGNSGELMAEVVKKLESRTIFWLDAHYSGGITAKGEKETPILEELDAILNMPGQESVILIDDVRYFVGENDYPTIPELKKFVLEIVPESDITIKHDIIRIVPGSLSDDLSS